MKVEPAQAEVLSVFDLILWSAPCNFPSNLISRTVPATRKTPPHSDAAIIMFCCRDGIGQVMSCIWFPPNCHKNGWAWNFLHQSDRWNLYIMLLWKNIPLSIVYLTAFLRSLLQSRLCALEAVRLTSQLDYLLWHALGNQLNYPQRLIFPTSNGRTETGFKGLLGRGVIKSLYITL